MDAAKPALSPTTAATVAVVNPNSSAVVTAAIGRTIEASGASAQARFRCVTLADGPAGVVSQTDADLAAVLSARWIAEHEGEASAFVIACFSDPGLAAARERTRKPVVGIGEAGMLAALAMGHRVGVIAVAGAAIARHLRRWRLLELDHRVAGERALDVSVEQSGDPAVAFERMREVGAALRDRDGADVLLLGCAGMADLCAPLQDALGLPVVDPCAAAAQLAALRLRMASGARG